MGLPGRNIETRLKRLELTTNRLMKAVTLQQAAFRKWERVFDRFCLQIENAARRLPKETAPLFETELITGSHEEMHRQMKQLEQKGFVFDSLAEQRGEFFASAYIIMKRMRNSQGGQE